MGDILGPKEEHIKLEGRTSPLSDEEKRHARWCARCKREVARANVANVDAMRKLSVEMGATAFVLGALDKMRETLVEQFEILAPGFQEKEPEE